MKKWGREHQLSSEEIDYIACSNPKHAKAYTNIKTHKQGWPYRFIISPRQTAIEKLARWARLVEFQFKDSNTNPAYLKDTKHFLKFIKDLNENQGPFKENEIIMVYRDIEKGMPGPPPPPPVMRIISFIFLLSSVSGAN